MNNKDLVRNYCENPFDDQSSQTAYTSGGKFVAFGYEVAICIKDSNHLFVLDSAGASVFSRQIRNSGIYFAQLPIDLLKLEYVILKNRNKPVRELSENVCKCVRYWRGDDYTYDLCNIVAAISQRPHSRAIASHVNEAIVRETELCEKKWIAHLIYQWDSGDQSKDLAVQLKDRLDMYHDSSEVVKFRNKLIAYISAHNNNNNIMTNKGVY